MSCTKTEVLHQVRCKCIIWMIVNVASLKNRCQFLAAVSISVLAVDVGFCEGPNAGGLEWLGCERPRVKGVFFRRKK